VPPVKRYNHYSKTRHCPPMTASDIVRLQKRRACEDKHKRSSIQTVQTKMWARLSKTYQGHYTLIRWIGKCMEGNGCCFFLEH